MEKQIPAPEHKPAELQGFSCPGVLVRTDGAVLEAAWRKLGLNTDCEPDRRLEAVWAHSTGMPDRTFAAPPQGAEEVHATTDAEQSCYSV